MPEWRPIPGYEATYAVSDAGEIRSIPRRRTRGGVLRQHVGRRGYPVVSLVQGGHQRTHEVHRLVALAFIGSPPKGMEVRHIDGDKLRPALVNLKYGTRSQNGRDKRAHGTDRNVNKTHCPQGHPYDEKNTRTCQGRRYCRTCDSRKNRRVVEHPDFDPAWRV